MSEQEQKPFLFNWRWSQDAFNTALSLLLKNGNINSLIKFLPQALNLEESLAFNILKILGLKKIKVY